MSNSRNKINKDKEFAKRLRKIQREAQLEYEKQHGKNVSKVWDSNLSHRQKRHKENQKLKKIDPSQDFE